MALLEALLLGGHTWQVVGIVVFQVSRLNYYSHLVVGWVASFADGAASTELSFLFVNCFICVFDMYVLFMCCMSVFFFLCVHMPKGVYIND